MLRAAPSFEEDVPSDVPGEAQVEPRLGPVALRTTGALLLTTSPRCCFHRRKQA